MSENLHDIDDLFREPIEAHEEMPSARVWNEIDHGLDRKSIALSKKKYNKLKLFSAALLLLLMSVIVFQLVSKNKTEQPADKTADTANTETVHAAAPGKLGNSNATKKSMPSEDKSLANETLPLDEQPPEAAVKSNAAAANSAQQTDENKVSAMAVSEAVNSKGDAASPNRKEEIAVKVKPGAAADKAVSNRTPVVSGQNKAARQEVAAGVSSELNNETTALNKAVKVKDSIAAGTSGRTTKLNRSSPGKNADKNETALAGIKEHKQALVKTRDKKLKLQQHANSDNTEENFLAAGSRTTAALNRETAKGNIKIELPVRMIRPLAGVWVQKNSGDEIANLPIIVSIVGNDAMPAWVQEKAAVMPVIAKKSSVFHFSIMPFFSPQFSFNRIETDEDHRRQFPQWPNDREKIRNDETYTASSAWGVLVAVPLGRKWGLQSGFSYNSRSVDIQPKKIYAQLANDGKVKYRFDCSSGYTFLSPKAGTSPVVGDSITVASSSNNLQYIGIPLTLNYTFFGTKKFNVIPELGLMANFLVKQSLQTSLDAGTSQQQHITSIQGLRKTYFNGMAGLGLQYNISKRISLNLVPAVNFAFNSINQNAAVKSYLNSFSVTGGVKLQF